MENYSILKNYMTNNTLTEKIFKIISDNIFKLFTLLLENILIISNYKIPYFLKICK